MLQIFSKIDDYIPTAKYKEFDFKKFYDDEFNNPGYLELK